MRTIAAEANQLTLEQIAAGWISLFDGETLFGWHPTSDANWKVEDGAITVSEGDQGFLMTGVDFADYELHVEFKAPATTNSGLFLRMPLGPKDPAKDCIELNIAPIDNPFPTGSLVSRLKTPIADGGSLREAGPQGRRRIAADKMPNPWDGQWHALDVSLNGRACEVAIDGVVLAAYMFEENNYGQLADDAPLRGRIALQFREGPVAFRSIRLKPLGLTSMFNGKDLSGWNTSNVEASKFEVVPPTETSGSLPLEGRAGEEGEAGASSSHPSLTLPVEGRGPEGVGELRVANGRGILETEAAYGDFVMQLEAFVDGDNLNSGIFFRSIPREYANGYESQIHNGFKDGDPTQPTDFGTGAIYRRIRARRVVSKDREWFAKTLVATGPHIAVWVNGTQVTDWTDEREPNDNPRAGLRTAPGTISIQGHDPTTNLRFRRLRIVELPKASD